MISIGIRTPVGNRNVKILPTLWLPTDVLIASSSQRLFTENFNFTVYLFFVCLSVVVVVVFLFVSFAEISNSKSRMVSIFHGLIPKTVSTLRSQNVMLKYRGKCYLTVSIMFVLIFFINLTFRNLNFDETYNIVLNA